MKYSPRYQQTYNYPLRAYFIYQTNAGKEGITINKVFFKPSDYPETTVAIFKIKYK